MQLIVYLKGQLAKVMMTQLRPKEILIIIEYSP